MSADLSPLRVLLVTLAGWVNHHQQHVIEYLVEENRVLKAQVKGRRLQLTDEQRPTACAEGAATRPIGLARQKRAGERLDLLPCDPASPGRRPDGMSGKTILYVEDNELNRKIVRDLLRHTSYQLIEALDGETGVQMALEQRPDLILMDVQFPKISGFEATRRLRAEPATADVRGD
jgi:PleD family two-component response regulator